ncbi:MAG: glycosyltransferase family 4 protein [Chloroflexi bacterium]|nr:glycosyltransferase family 4 protein [Chloroflexota bacterium]
MNIGVLLPGFSSHAQDWALPVQLNLARALAAQDQLRVIALRYPHRRDQYRIDSISVFALGAGQARGRQRLRLWLDAFRLIRRLHHETPFDVLHAMWADETGLIAAWAGRWLQIPVVVSILGGELVRLHDIGYGLQLSAFSRWIVGRALHGADRIIIPSDYVRQLINTAGYRIPESKLIFGTLGVDAARFTPSSAPPDTQRLINVASLVPVKDQATLLRALALLEPHIHLDIIGVGPEQPRLEILARDLGAADRVHFIGAVDHPELPAYYQRAAIKVLSSRHEILAMATLEAAACRLPVVSTAVGTLPNYPSLGVTAPVGDHAALAAAIRALLDDPGQRQALGQSARQTILDSFTIEGTAAHLRALYRALRTTASHR